MSRGGRTLRCLLAAVAVAGPGAAWAAKLDKAACTDLANELATITATGVKADMQRGPEWAKANMPVERLQSIRRLLEIEDQLEFRCSGRGGRQKDKSPAPAPGQSETAEQPPARDDKPTPSAANEKRSNAPAMLAPVIKPPVAMQPVPSAPSATSTAMPATRSVPAATVTPPAAPAAPAALGGPPPPVTTGTAPAAAAPTTPTPAAKSTPQQPVVAATPPIAAPEAIAPATPPITKLGPLPSAAGPSSAAPAAAPGTAPAAKKPGDPAVQAARKKNSRRNPSSAYVSPGEVSPFLLPGMRGN